MHYLRGGRKKFYELGHNWWCFWHLQCRQGRHGRTHPQRTSSRLQNPPVYTTKNVMKVMQLINITNKSMHALAYMYIWLMYQMRNTDKVFYYNLEIVAYRGGINKECVFRCWGQTQCRSASNEHGPNVQRPLPWRRDLHFFCFLVIIFCSIHIDYKASCALSKYLYNYPAFVR